MNYETKKARSRHRRLFSFSSEFNPNVKTSVTELPFNSFLGIQISTESSQLLRLPSGEKYLNHLGTVHAPANGTVTSIASAAPESLAHLDDELASKGRSLIPITVELHDESGAHTLSTTIEWFIQRLSTDDKNT